MELSLRIILLFNLFFISQEIFGQENTLFENKLLMTGYKNEIMDVSIIDSNSGLIYNDIGTASYYGKKFHNKKTANGEIFNMNEYTAAHRSLPFGTILKVTNLENKKSVLVRINDRGPFINARILDLSYEAAKEIDGAGLPTVSIEGFIPKNNPQDINNLDNFFFGYSLNHPLICLNKSILNIILYTKNFNEAMTLYKYYVESHPLVISYLIVPVSQILHKDIKEDDKFYIALIHPVMASKIKEFVNITNKKIE
ncbi:MAG: septal ring lytic transglycosylase RlpA family protein [FCB group bacterium]|jgi:hypothetical protein